MGIRPIAEALRDRPLTVDELADRLHTTPAQLAAPLVSAITVIGCVEAHRRNKRITFTLTRGGRQFLENLERRESTPSRSIEQLMRGNQGISCAG